MQSTMRLHLRTTARSNRSYHGPISPLRLFSTSSIRLDYASTIPNLRIGSKTRVIFQGFTGRQATANAQESIAWGTNIVGGVTPGREGEHLGLPVLPTVRRAMEELKPEATGIYVPAARAAAAIEDAVEAEVPLIVAVAEHVPLHEMLRIQAMLKTQSKSRLVGPNSPGIISAAEGERCRIGFQPLPCFRAGCVGIAAKSGTLSYEVVAATTRAGLGQSLCVGVGGDILPGTDLVEALQVLETDPNTKAIALIGEIGGDGEILAAEWVREYYSRTPKRERKPIAALIAGKYAPPDRVMGHAGAFWVPGEPSAYQKVVALRAVGVTVVSDPAKIALVLSQKLSSVEDDAVQEDIETAELPAGATYSSPDDFTSAALGRSPQEQQTRGLHTSSQSFLTRSRPTASSLLRSIQPPQTRNLHLDRDSSKLLLNDCNMADNLQFDYYPRHYLALGIDRATRSQCITTAMIFGSSTWNVPVNFHKTLMESGTTDIMELSSAQWDRMVDAVLEQLRIKRPSEGDAQTRPNRAKVLEMLIRNMAIIFKENEAKLVAFELGMQQYNNHRAPFHVHNLRIELDDAAYKSGGRLADVHQRYAALEQRDPGAVEAEKDGIVYHRLSPGDRTHNIGTLVNGAGLAMHTVDALSDAGGRAANFLDTGGKATSETIKKSFEVILRDDRVKVIVVNIFGGLTMGDMIARGIILAFKETDIKVPVVVRIRGTNEKEGQRIIAESGLPLYAFDDFGEAVAKAIELAKEMSIPIDSWRTKSNRYEVAGLLDAISAAAAIGAKEGEIEEGEIVESEPQGDKLEEANTAADEVAAETSQQEASQRS